MSKIVDDIQAVVDRLHSEGNVIATKLENALHELKSHFTKETKDLATEVKADVTQVETDAAPVVAEVKTDAEKVATEVKMDVEANLAEAEDLVKKK